MRVVIVRPNSYILATAPPMGPASLAAWLKKKRGDDIYIIDARKKRLDHSRLADKVANLNPDVVGISALSVESSDASETAKHVKKLLPEVPIVMGGPHASSAPEEVMADPNVDFAVVSEGEESFRKLLDRIENGDTSETVQGVWGRYGGELKFGGQREPLDVSDLPIPAWNLLPMEDYFAPGRNTHDTVPANVRCLQILTSRGCPFRCIYCHGIFGKTFRPRSPESVISEVESIVNTFNLKAIEVCDDIFNLDMDRAKTILRGLISMNISVSFPNGIRGDRVDAEMLDLMEAAGVRRVSFAVESANSRVQKVIKKGLDLEKVSNNISAASKKHFLSTGYFILGFPDETVEEMEETIRFAAQSDLHIASFFYLTAFPGTEAAAIVEAKGLKPDKPPRDYSTIYVNVSAVPDKVLHKMRKRAYRKFYLNPRRLWRTFFVAPRKSSTFILAWKILLLSLKDSVDY